MSRRNTATMMNTVNDYSHLKWPITLASVLTTLLAFILLSSFRSNSWFTYDLIRTDEQSTNATSYSRILEYGSVGLWRLCVGYYDDPTIKCDVWTKQTRPHSFNVIIALVSCALFLSNLTVFPSWASSLLIVYNSHNRYVRHITGFVWILLLLTLSFTILLVIVLIFTISTKFYSPGKYMIGADHLLIHSGLGFFYTGVATFLALISLVLIFTTLIWMKMIDMRLIETEKELLKQMSDDGYRPGWHKIVMAPRASVSQEQMGATLPPPPYEFSRR